MKLRTHLYGACFACAALLTAACTEDGGKVGIVYDNENITPSYAEFSAESQSMATGSVRGVGGDCYLGCIEDPETGDTIRASFATQFHTFENYKFPAHHLMFEQDGLDHSQDLVKCDSVEAMIFFTSYFGDGNNPMTLEVYALDRDKVIREDTAYYSDTDLMKQFVVQGAQPIATKTFAPNDYSLADSVLYDATRTANIHIPLPDSIGSAILNAYYQDPSNFRDSYTFIRNVCPGLYFRLKNGSGTMITVTVCTLNLTFKYYDTKKKQMVTGFCRFAATPEVMQCSQIERSQSLEELEENNDSCTYLKTPAGICTVVTLPIEKIFQGDPDSPNLEYRMSHLNDSINRVSITLTRYNNQSGTPLTMGTPGTLLMLRKCDLQTFFRKNKVTDGKTSFTTTYNSAYNNYTFANIARLVTTCWREKQEGTADEDWNKVVLIPVSVSSTQDSYGTNHVVSISHDMGLNSVKLVKGKNDNSNIPVQVVYSRFD